MPTVNLNVKLKLPEDVVRKAREAGLLTGEKIGELIAAEVRRQRTDGWEALQTKLAPVREKYGHLSDDDIQAMIKQWVAETDVTPDESSS